jgi:hypothetical protein
MPFMQSSPHEGRLPFNAKSPAQAGLFAHHTLYREVAAATRSSTSATIRVVGL